MILDEREFPRRMNVHSHVLILRTIFCFCLLKMQQLAQSSGMGGGGGMPDMNQMMQMMSQMGMAMGGAAAMGGAQRR